MSQSSLDFVNIWPWLGPPPVGAANAIRILPVLWTGIDDEKR